jgi:dihydrolipoamide dehydrogenase
MAKMLIDPDTNRLIGVGICGSGAGELIAEATLAMEMGATAEDIALTVHPHPTLSETVMECAEVFFGHATHTFTKKKPTL